MSNPITVYVLRSRSGKVRYIGITNDLERRMAEHRRQNCTVRRRLGDFEVIPTEEYPNHSHACEREKWLKSGAGREWLDSLESGIEPVVSE